MNTRLTHILAAAAVALFVAMPATGYHNDGRLTTTPGLNSTDWTLATPVLIICESEGLHDDRNANPGGNPGNGGLCTTGRNDATNLPAPALKPDTTVWTGLDLCEDTTQVRYGALSQGPYLAPAPCATVNTVAFTAELGTMFCTVAALEALVYNENYAWLTIDGDGGYTASDAPGALHGGDGDAVTNPVGPSDKLNAFQGHVAAFVDSTPAGVVQGSAETFVPGAPFGGLTPTYTALGCAGAGLPGPTAGMQRGVRGTHF